MLVAAASFLLLKLLPGRLRLRRRSRSILAVNGLGMGLFASPEPRRDHELAAAATSAARAPGMTSTFQNSRDRAVDRHLLLDADPRAVPTLPATLHDGLTAQGVPRRRPRSGSPTLPPVGTLFAALLGYNPIETLLGPQRARAGSARSRPQFLTGRAFFPQLISGPFADGLTFALVFAAACCVVAAVASLLRGGKYAYAEPVAADGADELDGAAVTEATYPGYDDADGALVGAPGRLLRGRVLGPDDAPTPAVLTLVDHAGRQAGRTEADGEGRFALQPPSAGDFLVIATPNGGDPTVAPRATQVWVTGGDVDLDLVLDRR